jgi:murein DD-endopeptidase MepM/ murein hydrolase activator NlpD
MVDFSDAIDGTGVCTTCGDGLPVGRYVQARGAALIAFCSKACWRVARAARFARRRAAALLWSRRLSIAGVFAAACLAPHQWSLRLLRARKVTPAAVPALLKAEPQKPPPGWFGPEWPPTEESLLAALGRDVWVHPLAGPVRRMPRADSRVFGAVRPGNRAWECRNGHCGVDLGGEIWGEHVHAAHDGVVDRVQRAANPEHGGRWVRIAHHGGTVFTQYFHLAAIPREIQPGVAVKAGQVVGLLGDTGVKESAPHLHFAMSIRLSEDRPEKYIDPEPLIALWPLRVPVDGTEVGLVTITGQVGVPLGSMPRLSGRASASKKGGHGAAPSPSDSGPAAGPEAPSDEEPPADAPAPTPEQAAEE